MTDALSAGLYERIVTEALKVRLAQFDEDLVVRQKLRSADAADRIAQLLALQVERALEAVPAPDRVATGVEVAQRLLQALHERLPLTDPALERPTPPGEVLSAISERQPDGRPRTAGRPMIPLLDTTLLTNAPGEPRVGHQVLTEIESADSIDVVMAFIRTSGLLPLREALRGHCARGRELRVLTTTYTQSTEGRALDLLRELGASVRISYDVSTTRLAVCGPTALRRPSRLADLHGPTGGQVTLDRSLDWSGDSTYDLDDPGDLQVMYQTVLNQAASAEDLNRWLDADVLRRVWPSLWLPARLKGTVAGPLLGTGRAAAGARRLTMNPSHLRLAAKSVLESLAGSQQQSPPDAPGRNARPSHRTIHAHRRTRNAGRRCVIGARGVLAMEGTSLCRSSWPSSCPGR